MAPLAVLPPGRGGAFKCFPAKESRQGQIFWSSVCRKWPKHKMVLFLTHLIVKNYYLICKCTSNSCN